MESDVLVLVDGILVTRKEALILGIQFSEEDFIGGVYESNC